MDPSDEVKARPEEFSPKPMNSCEFGTRRREFGALHRTTEFLWIWRKHWDVVAETIFDFSFVPCQSIQSHFFAFASSNSSFWNENFLNLFASTRFSRIPSCFSSWENQIDFLPRHRFLCVDLWPKPGMFYTNGQTCVLPKANPCFANVEGSVLLDSIWQCTSCRVLPK